MSNENKEIVNGIEIDTKKAGLILMRLIMREKTNIKTKQYRETEMVNLIRKMIEEEVECY